MISVLILTSCFNRFIVVKILIYLATTWYHFLFLPDILMILLYLAAPILQPQSHFWHIVNINICRVSTLLANYIMPTIIHNVMYVYAGHCNWIMKTHRHYCYQLEVLVMVKIVKMMMMMNILFIQIFEC